MKKIFVAILSLAFIVGMTPQDARAGNYDTTVEDIPVVPPGGGRINLCRYWVIHPDLFWWYDVCGKTFSGGPYDQDDPKCVNGCIPPEPPVCRGDDCGPTEPPEPPKPPQPPVCEGNKCPPPEPPQPPEPPRDPKGSGCNNGWGNNSQCAPGNSLNHNSAENHEGDRENGTSNPNGMSSAPGASGQDRGNSSTAPGQQGGRASDDNVSASPNNDNGQARGNNRGGRDKGASNSPGRGKGKGKGKGHNK